MTETRGSRLISRLYRLRWPLAGFMVLAMVALFVTGMGRIEKFSKQVDSLKDPPPEESVPRIFDPSVDIWLDPTDPALAAYHQIEEEFIPEDMVLVAFEETTDPWGVFGEKPLATIARVTKALGQVPTVRHVRSLTAAPWIRWGQAGPDEEGLLVTDLFENDPSTYTREQRLERMIAVLGARRAAAIAGEQEVRRVLGPGANLDDHIGEPRLVNGVVSEDGRTAVLQVLLLRARLDREELDAAFGDNETARTAGPQIHAGELQFKALEDIDKVLGEEKSYRFHVTGMPVWERHFTLVGEADLKWVGVMLLVLALALMVVHRRPAAMVIPLVVVFSSIVGMLGASWLMGDLMNSLTAMLPNVLVAVAIAESVHLVTAYYLLRPQFTDKRELITTVMKKNALPVFFTSMTTAIAFFSQMTSTLPPLKMEGYTGGIGVIFAYLLTMTVIPALLSLIPIRKGKKGPGKTHVNVEDESQPYWTDRFVAFAVRQRKPILTATATAIILTAVGVMRLDLNTDSRTWFPDGDPMITDLNWIEQRIGGSGDLEILFHAPPSSESPEKARARQARLDELQVRKLRHAQDSASSPPLTPQEASELERIAAEEARAEKRRIAVSIEFLTTFDAFERRLRKEMADPESPLHVIARVDSPLDVLKKIHQVQNQNKAAFHRLPTDQDVAAEARTPQLRVDEISEEVTLVPAQDASTLVAQYYVQYENGAKPIDNLSTLISPDRSTFRLAVRLNQASSDEHQAAFRRIRTIAREEVPAIAGTAEQVTRGEAMSTMRLSGRQFLFANLDDNLTATLLWSLLTSIIAITILIAFLYMSVRLALVSLIPNVVPIMFAISWHGLLGVPLEGPAVFVAALVLGVAIDDTVHLMTKFQEARKAGLAGPAALRRTFRSIGAAVTNTTVILAVGFTVLLFSAFAPNREIGRMATIMIALAWVADLVVTPALLSYMYPDRSKPSARQS